MLYKEINNEFHEIKVNKTKHCFDKCDFLRKEAAAESVEYFDKLKPKENHLYFLVIAMTAGENYGSNRNGDYFKEEDLKKYYKIFENSGVFWNHDNKDPSKSFGRVLKAFYNDKMHRVELVIEVPTDKSRYLKSYIDEGKPISVSMGLNTPCFPKGTHISLPDGSSKCITEFSSGESVPTSQGNIKKVIKTTKTPYSGELIKISPMVGNILTPTPAHKFHVIDFRKLGYAKKDLKLAEIVDIIADSDKSIDMLKEWVSASDLDPDRHILTHTVVQSDDMTFDTKKKFIDNHGFVLIKSKEIISTDDIEEYDGYVYDLVVEDDHSFIAEKINVHNSETCSICGHVTKGSYANRCEHLKFMMNTILHDGKKVYAISGTPLKLFDISFVFRPADKIAYAMLTKSASRK